jgi:hypothetical protein
MQGLLDSPLGFSRNVSARKGFPMDFANAYAWGKLVNSSWEDLVRGMSERASVMRPTQTVRGGSILWLSGNTIKVKFFFIVVKQPDESETRGNVVFDIFRMNPLIFLWHDNRVYAPPK